MPVMTRNPGVVGLPAGVKESGKRVDFQDDDFIIQIETHGYRLAWTRTSYCPCAGVNTQTGQPNPTCSLCEGSGWLRFRPRGYVTNPKIIGTLDTLQTSIAADAAVIMGLSTGIAAHDTPYDEVMRRMEATVNITTRPENRLGYHDRLVNLDGKIVYTQTFKTTGNSTDSLRYPVVELNLLRTESTVYVEGTDFTLVGGNISWTATPPTDTKFAAHYLTYPYWRVVEYPHHMRQLYKKAKVRKPTTPMGDVQLLPVQSVCKLEFTL